MSIDRDIGDTLALVNVARQAFGQSMLTELPDSRPGATADCLFYRALSDIGVTGVSGGGGISCRDERQAAYIGQLWGGSAHGNVVQAPRQFESVISRFDRDKLPHYNTQAERDF